MKRRRLGIAGSFFSAIIFVAVNASAPLATAASAPSQPITWLAAGDSYSSGMGLPHSSGSCARADGRQSSAYAQVAAGRLASSTPIQLSPPDFVACSGARTGQFFAAQGPNPAEWSGGRHDLVTFTLGGDDLDVTSVIQQCVESSCPDDAVLRQRLAVQLSGYQQFLGQVAAQAVTPGGNIVVLGYPELIEDPARWTGSSKYTGLCAGITRSDANELRGLGGDLNATIGWAVQQVNSRHPNNVRLTFVDVNSGGGYLSRSDPSLFEPSTGTRHNLCSADPWTNGFTAIAYGKGSFHPKQAGQDAEGALLAEVIGSHLSWNLDPSAT